MRNFRKNMWQKGIVVATSAHMEGLSGLSLLPARFSSRSCQNSRPLNGNLSMLCQVNRMRHFWKLCRSTQAGPLFHRGIPFFVFISFQVRTSTFKCPHLCFWAFHASFPFFLHFMYNLLVGRRGWGTRSSFYTSSPMHPSLKDKYTPPFRGTSKLNLDTTTYLL